MRVLLAGTRWLGAAVFDALRADGHDVVAVWDRTGGRLAVEARAAGVRVLDRPAIGHPGWLPAMPDLVVSAHCTWLIDDELLWRCPKGGVGYHPSLLPRHRGGDAVRWTVHMGERIAGGTVYWLTGRADAGPILAQDWCHVRPDDTAVSLWRRELAPMGVRMLVEAVRKIDAGSAPSLPQDEALATWEPSFRRARLAP